MVGGQIIKNDYLKVLFISILLAVLATFLLHLYMDRYISAATGGEKVAVLTPVKDINKGTTITDDMLKVHMVPANYVPENAIKPEYKDYILGQKAAFDIKHGGYIIWTDIAIEKEVMLSQTLLPGERAVTIRIDDVGGINGFIEPGDGVDILVTFDVPGEDYKSTKSFTKILFQDVDVLAVGHQTVSRSNMEGLAKPEGLAHGVAQEAPPKDASTITLKLKPEEAAMLTFAEEKGRIRLILRNREDVKFEKVKDVNFKRVLESAPREPFKKFLPIIKKERYGYPVIYIEGKEVSSPDEMEKIEESSSTSIKPEVKHQEEVSLYKEKKKEQIDEPKKKLEDDLKKEWEKEK